MTTLNQTRNIPSYATETIIPCVKKSQIVRIYTWENETGKVIGKIYIGARKNPYSYFSLIEVFNIAFYQFYYFRSVPYLLKMP